MDVQIVAVVFAYNDETDAYWAYRKNIRYLSMPAPPIRFQKTRITNVNHSSALGRPSSSNYVIL